MAFCGVFALIESTAILTNSRASEIPNVFGEPKVGVSSIRLSPPEANSEAVETWFCNLIQI